MYRTFSLADIPLLANLAKQGILLDLEEKLLGPMNPLWSALAGFLLLTKPRIHTEVLDESRDGEHFQGFLQGRTRAKSNEADIYFLAPPLAHPHGLYIWETLITNFCQTQGEKGAQRIFVKIPEDFEEALDVFRQVGFGAYARRHIYRRSLEPRGGAPGRTISWRPRRDTDSWGLMRLYSTVTPSPVQVAEGLERQKEGPPAPWFRPAGREEYVAENKEEIIGFLRIISGRKGYWMKFILHPDAEEMGPDLLHSALTLLAEDSGKPVYCGVREYEGALKSCISHAEFQVLAGEVLMVKHTTVRAGASQPGTRFLAEKKVERVTPAGMQKG
ncbi:MAG: hypothetical protein HYX86_02240 [Chloroflexi bacterium]|nr:hypothetical protein [Chloroflexota bacterium]